MPDYQNGKIYKLWSPEGDDIYIGSTTETLCRRKAGHKNSFNAGEKLTSKVLFEKYTDVRIELIEECPCDKKCKLIAREGHYIRTLECVNKLIPNRKHKEWREDTKEQRKEYDKKYRENNKEKIKEQKKEIDKQYRENNKEYFKEHKKEYYENNKNRILEHISEKIICECGCEIRRGGLAEHKRSQKHIKLMENI
tara:strand:- start:45 stop:629 length:585 start_codon:yes stop_codon:yes gene_type:complete